MKLNWVNSISRQVEPSRLESSRTTWAKPSSRYHQVESACLVWSLWFHQVCPWFLPCLGPPQRLCHVLSTEVNLRTVWRGQLLHITTPCRQPDLVASSTVVNGLSFGRSSLTLFKGFGPRMRPPEIFIRGLGNTGSSLSSCPSLSLDNLLYREDFPGLHTGVDVSLVQAGFTGLSPDV